MIRVLLVDDHAILRDGLRAILAAEPDVEVVGEAADGVEAIKQAVTHKPDVVLLDLSLPMLSGLDVLRELSQRKLNAAVLVLSMHDAGESVRTALAAGARGYLVKGCPAPTVVQAVRAVFAGKRFLAEPVASKVLDALLDRDGAPAPRPVDALSRREQQVMRLVCEGKSSAEIGRLLNLSPKTVDTYRARLMQKLGVNDVPALVKLAIRENIIDAG
jgi:DNA-binding NarL/FixJ family response regulator